MKNRWNVTVNGINHEIWFRTGFFKSKVFVDGVSTPVKSSNKFIRLFDVPVDLDGAIVRLTAIGNKVDLAVDEVYLNSKKPYVPFETIPKWVYILLTALYVGGYMMCGVLGFLLSFLASMLIIKRALTPEGKNLVLFSIVISAVCILLNLGIFIGVTLMAV